MSGFWNEERLAYVEGAWREGKRSATEIAVYFGCTRNAIMGIIYRHQFKRDVTDAQRTTFQNKTRRKRKTERVYPQGAPRSGFIPVDTPEPSSEYAMGFFEIGPCQCRWPQHAADPNIYYLVYCGAPTRDLTPWCDYHAMRAFERRR